MVYVIQLQHGVRVKIPALSYWGYLFIKSKSFRWYMSFNYNMEFELRFQPYLCCIAPQIVVRLETVTSHPSDNQSVLGLAGSDYQDKASVFQLSLNTHVLYFFCNLHLCSSRLQTCAQTIYSYWLYGCRLYKGSVVVALNDTGRVGGWGSRIHLMRFFIDSKPPP